MGEEGVDPDDTSCGFDECLAMSAGRHILDGDEAFERGDFHKAIQEYDQALKFDSDNPNTYTNKARALGMLNQWETSLEMTVEARKRAPKYMKVIYRQAVAFDRLG